MKFKLRKVEKQDWDFIWTLRVETMKEKIVNSYGWNEDTQRSYAEETYDRGQIVLVDNKPIGVVTLSDWEDQLHLTWIAIVPEFQRKGIGTKLIEYCQQKAFKHQKPLTLQVLSNNQALYFYEKCGFRIINKSDSEKLIMRWFRK